MVLASPNIKQLEIHDHWFEYFYGCIYLKHRTLFYAIYDTMLVYDIYECLVEKQNTYTMHNPGIAHLVEEGWRLLG